MQRLCPCDVPPLRCGLWTGKCIYESFNVGLNSCCFFTGSLNCLQAASSAVLSILLTQKTVCSTSLFASELKTELICPQPLRVLVVTNVDKLLVQLVRIVHRFTNITANLAHRRLTIQLAAVELDLDVRAHLLRLLQSLCLARPLHTV